MRRSFASLCFGVALAAAPSLATAQNQDLAAPVTAPTTVPAVAPAATSPSTPEATRSAGPSVQSATVALRHRAATAPAPAPAPRANTANNRALIVVGAAGLLVGAIVGGDAGTIVMLGSAGIGLFGLYRLLT